MLRRQFDLFDRTEKKTKGTKYSHSSTSRRHCFGEWKKEKIWSIERVHNSSGRLSAEHSFSCWKPDVSHLFEFAIKSTYKRLIANVRNVRRNVKYPKMIPCFSWPIEFCYFLTSRRKHKTQNTQFQRRAVSVEFFKKLNIRLKVVGIITFAQCTSTAEDLSFTSFLNCY